jgi:hypothetical protein
MEVINPDRPVVCTKELEQLKCQLDGLSKKDPLRASLRTRIIMLTNYQHYQNEVIARLTSDECLEIIQQGLTCEQWFETEKASQYM